MFKYKPIKCQHEWRTLYGWKTECDNCGLTLEGALYQAEKKIADLTARAEQAEAKLNKIIIAAKIRKQVIAQAQERVLSAKKRPYTGVEIDLYAVKNADRELYKVLGELLEGG